MDHAQQISINDHKRQIFNYRDDLVAIFVGTLVFGLSYIGASLYTKGDQLGYSRAYEIVHGLSLPEARDLYLNTVSGADYIHFILVWLASSAAVPKTIFMSLLNGALAAYAVRLFQHWGGSLFIASAIVLTNFYMYVLYLAAERLKIGFLFLFISLLYINRIRLGVPLFFLAILSHLSVLFIGFGVWANHLRNQLLADPRKPKATMAMLFVALVIIATLFFSQSTIIQAKLNAYLYQRGALKITDFIPITFFFVFSVKYSRQFWLMCLIYFPIILAVLLLGGSRINMLAYFVFLFTALSVRGGLNFGILFTSAYLAYKSVRFCINIYQHGHGFPAP